MKISMPPFFQRMMKSHITACILVALGSLLLAACGAASPSAATPTQAAITQGAPELTATSAPSPTPLPGKVILLETDGIDAQPVQALLAELSAPAGWVVETRPALQPAEIPAEAKVVVMLAPAANYAELAAAAPQAQFIIFSPGDLPAAANLTVIRQRAENQAFLAGFISALIAQDYRAAGLLPADGLLGGLLQEAFVNGGRYFCGVCAPGWPLRTYYPVVAALPAASDGPSWQAAAAGIFDNQKAQVYYLAPEAARPEVVDYLRDKVQVDRTVVIVGAQPPIDALIAQWAASVRFDDLSALRQAWPDVAAGKGGAVVEDPLLIDNVNPDLLSPGRMRLVNELLDEIKAGRISPYSIAP